MHRKPRVKELPHRLRKYTAVPRERNIHMGLHPHTVANHAVGINKLHQRKNPRRHTAVKGIVIVVQQGHLLSDTVLPQHLIRHPVGKLHKLRRLPAGSVHPQPIGIIHPGMQILVHHIPGIHHLTVPMAVHMPHHIADIKLQPGIHYLRTDKSSLRRIILSEKPGRRLVIPHQRNGTHPQTVLPANLQGIVHMVKEEHRHRLLLVILRNPVTLLPGLLHGNQRRPVIKQHLCLHIILQRNAVILLF